MNSNITRRSRKVHLDFHTPAWVENIGTDFDADEFISVLNDAHVDSICVFAKCCHGLSYYNTKVGKRHPNLSFDLLAEMVTALRRASVAVSVYYTVVWDDLTVDLHPQWAQRDRHGNARFGFGEKWRTVCVNSPYTEEIVIPQVREIITGYDPDELWFDMLWVVEEECFCDYCRSKMLELGLNPELRSDRVLFSDWTDEQFMKRITAFAKSLKDTIVVTYNNCVRIGARRKVPYMDVFEIESLPHAWGYWYFPLYARYIRTLGLPVKGMTCRFHTFWGDFGSVKPIAQLQFEAATMLSQGAGCVIGDQLYPRGKLETAAYTVIGEVYDFVRRREEYSIGWKPVTQIALIGDIEPGSTSQGHPSPQLLGALKILMELHHQFDVVDEDADFTLYDVLVVADAVTPSKPLMSKIEQFVRHGGKLLFTGQSLGYGDRSWYRTQFSIEYHGQSLYSLDYIRTIDDRLKSSLPEMDIIVYDRFSQVKPTGDAHVLAKTVHPLEERTPLRYMSHLQASPGRESDFPSIVGRGDSIIYIAAPIFKSYFESGNPLLRHIVDNCLRILLPKPVIQTDAPPSTEVSLLQKGKDLAVHIANYSPSRRGNHPEVVDEVRPLLDIHIKVHCPERPRAVFLFPDGEPVECLFEGNTVSVLVPRVEIHRGISIQFLE